MDLIYFFLFLLQITNQLPPNHPLIQVLPINYQTSSFTITILPRTFPDTSHYRYFKKLYNLANQPLSEKDAKELESKTIVLNRYGQTIEEEAEGWFLGLYPYIPECNKNKRCTAVILRFTPEQLQKDNEQKIFDYIYHKQFGQSKAVSHVEEAIHVNGDKFIIAEIDEMKALWEFYRNLAENKSVFLGIICQLGFIWGLIMIFFGKKMMNFVGVVTGFTCTALLVNFWSYPAKLSEYYSQNTEGDFYWKLALVLGSGLLTGFLARKSEKVVVCIYYGLIGFVVSGFLLIIASLIMQLGTGYMFFMFMFGMEVWILNKLTKFILKHYLQAATLITALFGGISVSLSIYLYFGEGIMMERIGTRSKSLLIYLAIFLTWYGRKCQLERELIRRIPQEKNANKKAEGKKRSGVDGGFRNHWKNYEPPVVVENNNTAVGE